MRYKICELCKKSFRCSGAPRIGKDGRPLLNKPKVAYALDYGCEGQDDGHSGGGDDDFCDDSDDGLVDLIWSSMIGMMMSENDCQVDLCKKRKFHEKFGGHHYFLRW